MFCHGEYLGRRSRLSRLQAALTLNAEREILKCHQCRRAYPIKDDIPILLKEQAVIEDQ